MWLAVNKNGVEKCFHNKPKRYETYWEDVETYNEIRAVTTSASDYSMVLPKGSIEKLIGRKLTWENKPVELKLNYNNGFYL